MKNNTKIRLHLSKQLFESLTKQVIAEAKVNGGGAYTETVKQPKAMKEVNAVADTSKMKKTEEMETGVAENPQEKKVTITLNEYTGDEFSYDLGAWAIKNFPQIAKALKGAATGDGQEIASLGNTLVGLATAGTFAVTVGLAMAKDSIVAAAKKIKNAVKGTVSENNVDAELADIVAKMPEDLKAKIASK